MYQQTVRKGMVLRRNQQMHALGIIMASLILQICCSFISGGMLVHEAEALVGDPWKAQYPRIEASYLTDIWAVSEDNVFVVGYNFNGAVIGHYNGLSWQIMEASILGNPYGALFGIWGSSESNIFAVGGTNNSDTLILHYNGFEWSVIDQNFSRVLFDVWGTGPDDVFAAGEQGLIIHWDGNSWTQMDTGATAFLYGIWGDEYNNIYVAGENVILSYQEGGTWEPMPNIPPCYLFDICGVEGGDIYAVGDCILHYHNGQWQDVTPGELDSYFFQLNSITGRSANDIIAVGATDYYYGEEGLILRYDGESWQIEDVAFGNNPCPGDLEGAWMGEEEKIILVGGNAVLYGSTKGILVSFDGDTWSMESSEFYNGTLYQIWANSSHDVFAVGGYEPDIYMTQELAKSFIAHYDGLQWSRLEVEENGALYDIWGTNNELFAVGGEISWDNEYGWEYVGAQILYSSDGIHWQSMNNNFEDILQGVWGSSPENVFAVGYKMYDDMGSIFHFDGVEWAEMQVSLYGVGLSDIWGYNENDIFAVGFTWEGNEKAVILHYNGSAWAPMDHDIYDNLNRVWGSSPGDVFAVGENGLYHYNGLVWSPSVTGIYYDDVWGTSPTDVFAIGDNGIEHYNGQEWQNTGFIPLTGSYLYGIGGTSSNDVFVVGDYGRIYHYGTPQSGQQKIFLRQGWNLISFQVNACIYEQQIPPVVSLPDGIELREVGDLLSWLTDTTESPIRDAQNLSQVGNWQRITSFDREGAHMMDKDDPPMENDLHYLSAGYGYWIKMNAPGYLVLEGSLLSSSFPLRVGWNLIGSLSPGSCYYDSDHYGAGGKPTCIVSEVPSVTFEPVSGAAQLIQTVFASIEGKYRRITGFDCEGANMYDIQDPIYECDLFYIAPGCGYWIKMTEEGTLTSP